jgi:hypothetical protein
LTEDLAQAIAGGRQEGLIRVVNTPQSVGDHHAVGVLLHRQRELAQLQLSRFAHRHIACHRQHGRLTPVADWQAPYLRQERCTVPLETAQWNHLAHHFHIVKQLRLGAEGSQLLWVDPVKNRLANQVGRRRYAKQTGRRCIGVEPDAVAANGHRVG